MTDTQFQFNRNFYKLFYIQEQFLNSFAPEPLYLQTLSELPYIDSLEARRQLIASLRKHIQHKLRQLALAQPEQLLDSFLENLGYCEHLLAEDRREFFARVDSLNNRSYQLRHITGVQVKIDFTTERYAVVLRNIANLRHTCNLDNIKQQLQLHYKQVSKHIDLSLLQASKMSRDDMSIGSHSLKERINSEVQKKMLSFRVPSDELQSMKSKLFDSEASLATKQRLSRQTIEIKTRVAKSQLRSISDLEMSILEMERKIDEIGEAKSRASAALERQKSDMSSTIIELVRLTRLVDTLNQEIGVKMAVVSKQLKNLDDERQRVLNDPNLTEEERQAKLKEIDEEIEAIKIQYSSEIELLEAHKSGLNLEIGNKLRKEIEELELLKVGKTSSECLRINEKIKLLQRQISDVEVAAKISRSYIDGEFGRYYIGVNGEKIFKTGSLASEYMLVDGKLVKVRSAAQLLFDDTGDFYIGANGEKVYVQKYEVDEYGRFFIDKDGNKIYKASPYAIAFKMENGQLVQVAPASCLISDETGDYFIGPNGNKIYLKKYETDEFGRYYVDADGNRIYKAGPNAAEYKMIDGKLVKVKSAMYLLYDETGDYYLDENGNKVYVRQYEMDEIGRYYIDADGNKIYKAGPYSAEYKMINGVLTIVKEAECDPRATPSVESLPPAQTHFEYVKEHLGKALRRALAATIVHQPSDPINFIANHLLKQRHAELAHVVRQIEEQTIREERTRVVVEEEQKKLNAVMDPCNPCAQFA